MVRDDHRPEADGELRERRHERRRNIDDISPAFRCQDVRDDELDDEGPPSMSTEITLSALYAGARASQGGA
jgi:hypothetical protein